MDVHQEENDSRLEGGSVISNEIESLQTHLEVPRNFLFPPRNQSLRVATDWEPPTHIRDDLFPNLQAGPHITHRELWCEREAHTLIILIDGQVVSTSGW